MELVKEMLANITVQTLEAGLYNYIVILLKDLIAYSLPLAPVAAPQNVSATSNTATSITVCFEFPEGNTQNGRLTSFDVTLVGTPFDTESQTVSRHTATELTDTVVLYSVVLKNSP